jgi:hypothetical protein
MIFLERDKNGLLKKRNGLKLDRSIYKLGKEFTISRTGVANFLDCKRCFYLNVVKGLKFTDSIRLTLQNTNDEHVKEEFHAYRKRKEPHPVMTEYGLNAIPFDHPDIKFWQDALRHGIKYKHEKLNLILRGGIDDVWTIKGSNPPEIIIADYKTQAKRGKVNRDKYFDDVYHQSYKFQLDFYRYLFFKNDFKIYPKAFLVIYNAIKERNEFGKEMPFERVLVEYKYEKSVDDIEDIVQRMKKIMDDKKIPEQNSCCQNCAYIVEGSKLIK